MLLLPMLWFLLSQICLGDPLSTAEMPMQIWDPNDEAPTWHLTVNPENAAGLGHQYVVKLVNECFNWVSKQPKAQGKWGTSAVVVCIPL